MHHKKSARTMAQVLRTCSFGRKIGFFVNAKEVKAFNVFLLAISLRPKGWLEVAVGSSR